jgi:hypothetical protein
LVGHRSASLLIFALYCILQRRSFSWCPFWHDYKLEGKTGLRFPLYDLVFKYMLSFSKHHFVVSNYEKKKTSTRAPQFLVRLPAFINNASRAQGSNVSPERAIDMLFVGRDVPHKQRCHAQKVANYLAINYVEIVPGERLISDAQLSDTYQTAKVVFIPSKYESYSLVAVEALLAGAVVVAFPNVLVGEGLQHLTRFVVTSEMDMIHVIENELRGWRPISNQEESFIKDYFSYDVCKDQFLLAFRKT